MSVGRSHRRFVVLALAAIVGMISTIARPDELQLSRRDADQLKQKVAAIAQFGERPSRETLRTTLTENEVNAYLAYEGRDGLPEGVVDPSVAIIGTGRLSGRAVVDLDAVRNQRPRSSLFDPINYLTGRLPITATGVLTTSNGVGRFQLESAAIGRLPIPKPVLQEIVGHYTSTPQNPAGISLDDPFPLPARIREIQVERGQALIVQ